jgi:hypothetical protein
MGETERRVWCEEGMLCWDGRILEMFPTDGRDHAWRLHAATVVEWEVEARRGVSLLKVRPNKKHYESALVSDQDLPLVRQIMAEVDAVT